MSAERIIRTALGARTVDDAQRVQDLIADDVGARYERFVGDRSNNRGLMSTPGAREYKLLELVTNAQDAVLERFAIERFGTYDAVPLRHPTRRIGGTPWGPCLDRRCRHGADRVLRVGPADP